MIPARIAAAVAAAALAAGCAPPPGLPPVLPDAQKDAVLRAARAVLAAGSCPGAAAEIADPPIPLQDPRLRGALWQPVRVEGCGRRARLNMLVADAGVVPLLPGATAADPPLQREGLRLAAMAVKDAAPNCERIAVTDTRPDAATGTPPEIGEAARRPWTELWVLSACGRPFTVQVRFAPAEGGTEIVVAPPAVGRPRD